MCNDDPRFDSGTNTLKVLPFSFDKIFLLFHISELVNNQAKKKVFRKRFTPKSRWTTESKTETFLW